MIFATECQHQNSRKRCGNEFCDYHREPDAVQRHGQKEGKKQYGSDLEDERAQKGDERRDRTVVECREKGRAVDGNSCKEEGEGKDAEAAYGHGKYEALDLELSDEDLAAIAGGGEGWKIAGAIAGGAAGGAGVAAAIIAAL